MEECIMKALVISKSKKAVVVGIALGLLALAPAANAHKVLFVPEAVCSTITTNMPLPTYVCCELYDYKHKRHVFHDQWVAGTCKNANVNAKFDMGCKPDSYVYGTNAPIPPIATSCQFSYSAIKHHHEMLY
jgi:hypothetical protein